MLMTTTQPAIICRDGVTTVIQPGITFDFTDDEVQFYESTHPEVLREPTEAERAEFAASGT